MLQDLYKMCYPFPNEKLTFIDKYYKPKNAIHAKPKTSFSFCC